MAMHKDFSELFDPSKPMLQVRNLTRLYPQKGGSLFRKPKQVHAVDGVSFTLQEREIFGVIGESGCGKSTLGRLLIRLEEPTSGEIDFYGISTKKLLEANPEQFHCLVQSVFQNPFDTFTPSDTIGAIMERPLKLHNIGSSDEERRQIEIELERGENLLQFTHFDPDAHHAHEFAVIVFDTAIHEHGQLIAGHFVGVDLKPVGDPGSDEVVVPDVVGVIPADNLIYPIIMIINIRLCRNKEHRTVVVFLLQAVEVVLQFRNLFR